MQEAVSNWAAKATVCLAASGLPTSSASKSFGSSEKQRSCANAQTLGETWDLGSHLRKELLNNEIFIEFLENLKWTINNSSHICSAHFHLFKAYLPCSVPGWTAYPLCNQDVMPCTGLAASCHCSEKHQVLLQRCQHEQISMQPVHTAASEPSTPHMHHWYPERKGQKKKEKRKQKD